MNSHSLVTRLLAACLLAAALSAAAAARAEAGAYVVVGCSDLNGSTIRPADGWYLAAGVYPSRNDCGARGGLFATSDRAPNLFRFDAPAGTTIARLVSTYRAHLSGAAPWAVPTFVIEASHGSEWEYVLPAMGYIGAAPIELAGTRASSDARGAKALRIGVRCELAGPCTTGGQPWARFYALAVVLDDARPPAVTVRAPDGHLRGKVDVAVTARDEGGGIYERALSLDGRRVVAAGPCPTIPGSLGGLRHVIQRVPCPLDAPLSAPLDTRAFADGAHILVARVEDIAGNARTASTRIVIDNRPPRAGTVTLTGDPAEALTAQPGGFAGEDVTYEYRWERCGGAGCAEIGGAVSRTYRTRSRDAGQRLRAVVAASDGGGTVRVASPLSGVVPEAARAPAAAPAGGAPPTRLTVWLERGRRRLRRTTVTWPARVRIRGRLTDLAGRPLPRTPVRMLERTRGGRWRSITGVRTRRDGRLTTFTRVGPSRQVRLVHRPASVTLGLVVRAAARVRIHRRGRLTTVSGRVRGGHVPRAGLRIRLQSRGFGGWRTRAVLRTDGLGRFSATGRAPRGTRLRILVPAQPGYPYARGVGRP
jgi:hypothetical protein